MHFSNATKLLLVLRSYPNSAIVCELIVSILVEERNKPTLHDKLSSTIAINVLVLKDIQLFLQ